MIFRSHRIMLQPKNFSDTLEEFGLARIWGGVNTAVVTPFKASPGANPRNRRPDDALFHVNMTPISR
jgi:hypothetical protein